MRSESLRSIRSTQTSRMVCDRSMARCEFKHPTTPRTMSPMRPLPHHPRCPIRIAVVTLFACMGNSQQVKEKPAADYTPKLEDITASTGIHFEHLSSPEQRYIVESMSGGVALFDYDGDGWLDIYFTNAPSVSMALAGKKAKGALYHNNHDGTFSDVTDKAGVG